MATYYNENDPYKVVWLKNLIRMGMIPAGEVDDRSIEDVRPSDLIGFRQCHFFAGIGGWAFALRLAEWPEEWEVWTASCPCQFKSSAARGANNAPDLWPPFFRLFVARSPHVLFGEQVANASSWFDGVCDDLEGLDYDIGAAILPSCSVGQDHQRNRLFFVGHADRHGESGVPVDEEVGWLQRYRGQPTGVVLSDGVSIDLAQMCAFGEAIVPQVAQAFIEAYMSIGESAS